MKISSPTRVLQDAVGRIVRAADTSTGASMAARGIRVAVEDGKVTFQASNSELSMSTTISATTSGDGERVLPARTFDSALKSFSAQEMDIDFGADPTSRATITAGPARVSLNAISPDGFPKLQLPAAGGVDVPMELISALRRVVPTASGDSARMILTGVLLAADETGADIVATDSYRLALQRFEGSIGLDPGTTVLVPAKTLSEMLRIFGSSENVNLFAGSNNVGFTDGASWVTSRLIEGEYPRYAAILPSESPIRVNMPTDALKEALRLTGVTDSNSQVTFTFVENECHMTSRDQDLGDSYFTTDVAYDGVEFAVTFNGSYLREGVALVGTEFVEFAMSDPMKPVLLSSPDVPGYRHVIMPVRPL